MSTGEWMADTPRLLAAGPLTHAATAVVTSPAGDVVPVSIVDGQISFDESHAPRVEATLTVHLDPDPALASRVDPRLGCRLLLSVGYARPDGLLDVHPVGDLALRSLTRNRPGDELELTARSDEALMLDGAPAAPWSLSSTSTAQAIVDTIHQVIPTATVLVQTSLTGPPVTITNQPTADRWTAIMDFADRMGGMAIYDDGLRTWHIADRPNALGVPGYILADGAAGTLLEVTEDVDREGDWFNRVQVVYQWTDAADVDHLIVGTGDAGGPYAPTAGNARVGQFTRDTPTTQAEATAAATTLVGRTITRARSYTLTAPSAYWVRPGDTVGTDEAGHATETHLVVAVRFDLRSGLMTLTTRQDAVNSLAAAGRWDDQSTTLTWDQVAVTQTWDTYTGG